MSFNKFKFYIFFGGTKYNDENTNIAINIRNQKNATAIFVHVTALIPGVCNELSIESRKLINGVFSVILKVLEAIKYGLSTYKVDNCGTLSILNK